MPWAPVMKHFAFLLMNASAFQVVFLTLPVSCRCFLFPAHAASGSGLGPGEAVSADCVGGRWLCPR